YALATELRTSLDFLFSAAAPADGLTATAHGDGHVREAAHRAAALPSGHGVVQRAGTRRTIDLGSGVRWERLTPGPDERVDLLGVIYEPSRHYTDARRPLRHDGRDYGLITSGTLHASVGFDTFELGPGDSIAFDSAVPHLYWNATTADVHAIWAVVHPQPGLASGGASPASSLARGCGSIGRSGSRCGGRTGNCGGARCRGRVPDHTAGGRSRKR